MKSLLKFELRKLFRMKLFYICLGLVVGLALLTVLGNYFLYRLTDAEWPGELFGMFAPTAVSILRSELTEQMCTLIIALFVTLYVCDDNRNNTLKNIYAKGYGRDGVYFSKFIIVLCVSVVFVFLDWLFAFVFGCMFFKVGSSDGTIAGTLVVQLLAVIAYVSLFYFITTLIKKTGGAVVTNVLVVVFFSLVLTLIDLVIYQIAKTDAFRISDYWIDGIISKVASESVEAKTFIISTVLSVVYAAGFIVGGMFFNRNREV